jgi:hypothetical protein
LFAHGLLMNFGSILILLFAQTSGASEILTSSAAFLPAQQNNIEQRIAATKNIHVEAEAYIKWLFRNNAKQGCVTYGNPHPRGDNYTGDNGACPEFSLSLSGQPIENVKAGFRIQSRFGQDFADWFETGDRQSSADASGESLGQNHAAALQLRGIFLEIKEPLLGIDWALFGSSSLDHWDAWTVGRVRFIDRFNAKGIFLRTSIGSYVDVLVARIAMAKLFGTANFSVLEEDLVTNPFWARDAIYAMQIKTKEKAIKGFQITLNTAISLDEEADLNDPDAPGSHNTQDRKDEITAIIPRFVGANASLHLDLTRIEKLKVHGLLAASYNKPNLDYVSNLARGGLGFSNIVFKETQDFAGTLRASFQDFLLKGFKIEAEYFNIGSEFNAVAGARREDDILLTDGFVDGGQLPTLNVANELIDFHDSFYESAVGWHGATLVLGHENKILNSSLETSFIDYNTNAQDRDMDVYPGFGGFSGFTDTDLFSYANTNDRGRDPRAVYRKNQDRKTLIFMARSKYRPKWWKKSEIKIKAKYILDQDGRNKETSEDDYDAKIMMARFSISAPVVEKLHATAGLAFDHWTEAARSGSYAGGLAQFLDYKTKKTRPFLQFKYAYGPIWANYHFEVLKKEVQSSDESASHSTGYIVRSVGAIGGRF